MKRALLMAALVLGCTSGGAESRDERAPADRSESAGEALAPLEPFDAVEPPALAPPDEVDPVRVAYSNVEVEVDGDIARTVVTEVLVNDQDSPIEASFEFTLPNDAAVTDFADWRDGVRVSADVAGADEARKSYEQAAARGERAALAEEKTGRRFSMQLSPIPGRGSRRVELSYTQTLEALAGERTYVFPAGRASGTAPSNLDIEVGLIGTREIAAVRSLNHADARVVRRSDRRFQVHLARSRAGLGADFVVRWNQPTDDLDLDARAIRVSADEPGYVETRFAFNRDPYASDRKPLNVVLIIDRSLSMAGEPLARAQAIAADIAEALDERDALSVVSFASDVATMAPQSVSAEHRTRVLGEVSSMVASGHSNLAAALDEAAALQAGRGDTVVVLLTDGQPTVGEGVDADMPAARADDFSDSRVVIGQFNYPSRKEALDSLFPAASSQYVPDGDAGDEVADALVKLAVAPVIEDLRIVVAGAEDGQTHGSVPSRLAMGESVRIMARTNSDIGIAITGSIRGRPIEMRRELALPAVDTDGHSGLPVEWARLRIQDLERAYRGEPTTELADEIRSLGTEYRLATLFTSFVSTDSLSPDRIKPGDPEIRVRAPRTALAVYGVLPWGEIVSCEWRETEQLWLGRFLVPRGAPDGLYRVRIFVTSQAGTELRGTLYYRVDSEPPEFELTASYEHGWLSLLATPVSAVFDRAENGDTLQLDKIDLRRLTVRVAGRKIPLEQVDDLEWRARIQLPLASGRHRLVLTAIDYASNSAEAEASVEVTR